MSKEMLTFLIQWAPTLIFLFYLIVAILFGALRGFRKSLILAIHAAVLFTVLLIVYLNIAGLTSTDSGLFNLVESIAGKGKISQLFQVSQDCQSFQDVFIEWIPKQMPENEGLALILQDNGAYLATLAQMAVRIVVALALGIIYILGIFLLYIVYLIFYPQRRHERNLEEEYYQAIKDEKARAKRNQKKEEKRKKKEALAQQAKEEAIAPVEEPEVVKMEEAPQEIEGDFDEDEFNEFISNMGEKEDVSTDENLSPIDGDMLEREAEPIDGDMLERDASQMEETTIPLEENTIEENEEEEEKPIEVKKGPFVYKKRRLLGALVGGLRNLVAGIIFLSFVGGFFYILAGGTGDDFKPEPMDWEDPNINLAYGAYEAIETYGTAGMFKILNTFRGTDNAPLYLFAADLVYQGGLKDEAQNINTNVYLRKELANYTRFARDTFNLVLKYGSTEIRNAVKNQFSENQDMMQVIINVMLKDGFQEEFNVIIDNFEETSYFVNLTNSLIISFVNHIDSLGLEESMGQVNLSLIKLLFQKGYLADEIPYEKYVKDAGLTNELANYYITPNMVLNKHNAKTVINMLYGYLNAFDQNRDNQQAIILNSISNILPMINDFSFFSEENQETMDMVLSRLYQFTTNTYFKAVTEIELQSLTSSITPVENPYNQEKYRNVSWVNEIKSLVNSLSNILKLYNHAYNKDATIIDNVFAIFDTTRATYQEDMKLYDDIVSNVGKSFLLGDVLGGEYGNKFIENGLKGMLPELSLSTINYSNQIDSNGNIVEYGEFYYLLRALKSFGENQDNKYLISDLAEGLGKDQASTLDFIDRLCTSLLAKDHKGISVMDNVLSSSLFRAIVSEFILSMTTNDTFAIYVDDSIREVSDGKLTRLITKEEMNAFVHTANKLVNIISDVDFNGDISTMLKKILCKDVYDCLDSKIVEGTMSNFLANNIGNEFVVLPTELVNKTGYISKDGHNSEIKNIIKLFEIPNFDIGTLTKSYNNTDDQMNSIIAMLKGLNEENYNKMFESKIIYYSLSKYLIDHKDGFLGDGDLIIPTAAKNYLHNEVNIAVAIKKEELTDFLFKACQILPDDMSNIDTGKLINSIVDKYQICENLILSATMTNMMVNVDSVKDSIDGIIIIPDEYKTKASYSALPNYTKENIWYSENIKLMQGLGALIGSVTDGSGNRVTITDTGISDYVYDSFKTLNEDYDDSTRLDVAYRSVIMQHTITKRIDEMDFLSDPKKLEVKEEGIYKEEELESLVDLIQLFDLDLTTTDVLSSVISTNTILKLLEPYKDKDGNPMSYSNLDHLYQHEITGLIITQGVEGATAIPDDAYESGKLYMQKTEAKAIIECLSPEKLDLDLNSFTFDGDNITVTTLKKCMYETINDEFVLDGDGNPTIISRILLQNLSEQVEGYDYIDIPQEDYDTTHQRIKENSAYFFLGAIESLSDGFKLSGKINNVTLPDTSNEEKMEPIKKSSIFRASVSKNIQFDMGGMDLEPIVPTSDVTTTSNYDNTKTLSILSGDETVNLFTAIKALNANGTLSNVELDIAVIATFDQEDRDKIYASKLISCRLSDAILSQTGISDYTYRTTSHGTYSPASIVSAINIKTSIPVLTYAVLDGTQMENYFDSLNPTSMVCYITISGPQNLTVGEYNTYIAIVEPIETTADKTVTWSIVSGSSYATIDASTGYLTAIASGTVTIRATSNAEGYTDIYSDYEITIA